MQRIKSFIYDCITLLVKLLPCKVHPKTLLLVKTNEIGDYVLWHNVLPYIKQSGRFRDYKITVLGNAAWKNLFTNLDQSYVDEVLWFDFNRFKKDMRYRYSMLKKVRSAGFEIVINTVISRCKRVDDAFILVQDKAYKIGNTSDPSNVLPFEKGYDKKLYDELHSSEDAVFEFYKNILFTQRLTQQVLPPDLKLSIAPQNVSLPSEVEGKKYFVVFTGSSRADKLWPTEYFVEATKYVVQKFGWVPVLGGSPSDAPYIDNFLAVYQGEAINLCGKTSLIQFASVLQHARLLISIDTGAVHIASSVGTTVFAAFNGSRYGRFAPYPKEINPNFYAVYPDIVDEDVATGNASRHFGASSLPYSAVDVAKIINKMEEVFSQHS